MQEALMGRKRILRLGKGWFGSGKKKAQVERCGMDLRSIFDLELKELENRLEVESVPRILACTLLSTAFTTNYLNCNLFC